MSELGSDRELDIILFGATGFVGRLVAQQLAKAPSVRIGLAGRSRDRLDAVQRSVGTDWPLLVADSQDPESIERLARSARVVVSTVGPYAPRGLPLVHACAVAGTSYADLTGEPKFVRDSIDDAHQLAVESGAKIVHACGFDSVPSDLGVQVLAERVLADGEGELAEATLLVVAMKGGLSGGTIDSMRVGIDDVRDDPGLARRIADPYLLSPDRADEPDLGRQSNTFLAERLADGTWVGPFIMASFNGQIVRRSNALQGHRYGRELRYREVVRTGRSLLAPVVAGGIAVGTGALAVGMRNRLTRPVLDRILPNPGEGPSEKVRREGLFRFEIRALTSTGARYVATVAAPGDPGYAATSVMLSQAALCLATDELPTGGGVLTPATAMNGALTARLRDNGFTFDVRRVTRATGPRGG
ncbi:MAG: saccharopine dehydrogenase NADP-binding domain-containing protein [Nakamurella sp.]